MLRISLVLACVIVTVPAIAQSGPGPFSTFPTNNPTVYLMDVTGTETTGRLSRFDLSSVTITTGRGEVTFDQRQVKSVDRRGDSLKNGAIIGALTGLAFGSLGAAMMDYCNRPQEPLEPCSTGEKMGVVGLFTALFSGIGVGIDALRSGRTRIYEAAGAHRAAAVTTIVPTVAPAGLGLSVSVGW
jgi:hypothetical protein